MRETIHLVGESGGVVEVRFLYSGRPPARWLDVEALVRLVSAHFPDCSFLPADVRTLEYSEYLECEGLFQPDVLDALANPIR